jgi:hypothetical protein
MKQVLLFILGMVIGYVLATHIYGRLVDIGMIAEMSGDSYHIGCKQAEGKDCQRKAATYEQNLLAILKAIKVGGE